MTSKAEAVQHEIDELRAWGYREGAKGSRRMDDPTSLRLMLDGFFHRFQLTPGVSRLEFCREGMSGEEYWLFSGLLPWWEEPGRPTVSQAELGGMATGRLRRIIRSVFATAAARGDLDRVTFLRGRPRDEVLRALGIGA